jgi:hypothetical protein
MDPYADPRPVSPYSLKGLALGVRNAFGQASSSVADLAERVRPLQTGLNTAPAAAAPVVVAPQAVPAPAAPPVTLTPTAPAPTLQGTVGAIQQRQQLLDSLKDGGVVGRDGKAKKPARGARRAMPTRGDQPAKTGVFSFADGGTIDQQPQGLVQGPGSGTSDSVPAEMPQGTYVLPADTTQQVNLSNGEFKVAPDTVMAMGAAALDALKDATHAPAEGQQDASQGEQPGYRNGGKVRAGKAKGARRGLANGGSVDQYDPNATDMRGHITYEQPGGTRTIEPQPGANTMVQRNSGPTDMTGDSYEIPNTNDAGAGRGKVNPPRGARRKGYAGGGLITDEDKPGGAVFGYYPQLAGRRMTSNTTDAAIRTGQLADGTAAPANPSSVRGLPAGVAPSTGGAGRGSVNPPADGPDAAPAQVAAPSVPATPALATTPAAVTPAAARTATGMMADEAQQPGSAGATAALGSEAGGDSQSASNIATMQRAGAIYRDIAAMQNGQNNLPAGTGLTVGPDRAAEHNAAFDRDVMIQRAARMGGRGASAILGLVGVNDRANADMAMAGTHEQGATTRAGMQEAGATTREQARLAQQGTTEAQRNDLEGRRVAAGEQETAVRVGVGRQQIAEGARMSRLRAKLDTTTDPTERRALQDQILAESGKTPPPNRFTVVPGGSGVDQTTGQVVREPSTVLDNQSGQFVHQGAQATRVSVHAAQQRC